MQTWENIVGKSRNQQNVFTLPIITTMHAMLKAHAIFGLTSPMYYKQPFKIDGWSLKKLELQQQAFISSQKACIRLMGGFQGCDYQELVKADGFTKSLLRLMGGA